MFTLNYLSKKYSIDLEIIKGGNSANYEGYQASAKVSRMNNLPLGKSMLLGCETINRKIIPGLPANAF